MDQFKSDARCFLEYIVMIAWIWILYFVFLGYYDGMWQKIDDNEQMWKKTIMRVEVLERYTMPTPANKTRQGFVKNDKY